MSFRFNIIKKHSTKAERVFYEILKRNHIPFRFREVVAGREVDFLLNNQVCVEIDGHPQSGAKSDQLYKAGYHVLHFTNGFVREHPDLVEKQLLQWQHLTMGQTSGQPKAP